MKEILEKFPGAEFDRVQNEVIVRIPSSFKMTKESAAFVKASPNDHVPAQPFVWKMANGCCIRIMDMEDSHLANSIKLIRTLFSQGRLEAMNNMSTTSKVPGVFRPAYQGYGLDLLVRLFKRKGYAVAYGSMTPLLNEGLNDEAICSMKPMFAHLLLEAMRRGIVFE